MREDGGARAGAAGRCVGGSVGDAGPPPPRAGSARSACAARPARAEHVPHPPLRAAGFLRACLTQGTASPLGRRQRGDPAGGQPCVRSADPTATPSQRCRCTPVGCAPPLAVASEPRPRNQGAQASPQRLPTRSAMAATLSRSKYASVQNLLGDSVSKLTPAEIARMRVRSPSPWPAHAAEASSLAPARRLRGRWRRWQRARPRGRATWRVVATTAAPRAPAASTPARARACADDGRRTAPLRGALRLASSDRWGARARLGGERACGHACGLVREGTPTAAVAHARSSAVVSVSRSAAAPPPPPLRARALAGDRQGR